MADRDLASNLEFWSGRGRGGSAAPDPDRPRKPYRRRRLPRLPFRLPSFYVPSVRVPSVRVPAFVRRSGGRDPNKPRSKSRPVAAAVLLAGLTAAWLFVGHQSHGTAAADLHNPIAPVAPATSPAITTPATKNAVAVPPGDAISRAVVNTADCSGLSASRPHVRCVFAGELMEIALYTPSTVGPAFRRIAGAELTARSGPSACAANRPDERAWSVASAPRYAVGRYVCRLEAGRAAMWWTHGDRLLHALAGDADLATLFAWWSAHPSE